MLSEDEKWVWDDTFTFSPAHNWIRWDMACVKCFRH